MYIVNLVVTKMSSSNNKFAKLQCRDTEIKQVETLITTDEDREKSNSNFNEIETKKIANTSTPIRKCSITKENAEDEILSPIFMRFTQDNVDDDVDVVWDWDSPHSKKSRCLYKKRILHSSPKIPKKQILFVKTKPEFNSLKAELENLVSQLSTEKGNTSDDCFILDNENMFVKPQVPEVTETVNACDPFDDDSLDEEMIKCSQRVEEDYNISKLCSSIVNNNKSHKHMMKNTIEDDSFDLFLEVINEEELLSQASSSSGNNTPNKVHHQEISKTIASPRSISRTNSVPVNFLTHKQIVETKINVSSFSRTKSEEFNVRNNNQTLKFSQEEIEKKRLEAKAILERKRKQNEIEKKRQEALERLHKKRMQRMQNNIVKPITR